MWFTPIFFLFLIDLSNYDTQNILETEPCPFFTFKIYSLAIPFMYMNYFDNTLSYIPYSPTECFLLSVSPLPIFMSFFFLDSLNLIRIVRMVQRLFTRNFTSGHTTKDNDSPPPGSINYQWILREEWSPNTPPIHDGMLMGPVLSQSQ